MFRGLRDRLARPIDFPDFAVRLVLVVTAAATCGLATAQSDTWWHLRAGQDIWRDHTVSLVDRYSYTVSGDYWPDHEWLWQFLAYGLHWLGGMPLLGFVNGLLAFGAIALAVPRRATRVDIALVLFAVPLVVGVLSIRPRSPACSCSASCCGFSVASAGGRSPCSCSCGRTSTARSRQVESCWSRPAVLPS